MREMPNKREHITNNKAISNENFNIISNMNVAGRAGGGSFRSGVEQLTGMCNCVQLCVLGWH